MLKNLCGIKEFSHLLRLARGRCGKSVYSLHSENTEAAEEEGKRGGWERHFSIFDEASASFHHSQALRTTTGIPFMALLRNLHSNSFLLPDWQAGQEEMGLSIQSNIFCFSLGSNIVQRALAKAPDPGNKNTYF